MMPSYVEAVTALAGHGLDSYDNYTIYPVLLATHATIADCCDGC